MICTERPEPDASESASVRSDAVLLAHRYLDDAESARNLVCEAAQYLLGASPSPGTADEARTRLAEEIRARGSRSVFERACDMFHGRWLAYAYRLMFGSPALAEDVVHEAVLQLLRADPDFTDPRAVHAWMRKAIHGAALALLGVSNREVGLEEKPELAAGLCDPGATPRRQAMRDERANYLQRALFDARPEDREAFLLRHLAWPPWKVSAIAEKQGVDRRTIYDRIDRVVVSLQGSLDEYDRHGSLP